MTVRRLSLYAKILAYSFVGDLRSKDEPTLKGRFLNSRYF